MDPKYEIRFDTDAEPPTISIKFKYRRKIKKRKGRQPQKEELVVMEEAKEENEAR